VNTSESRVSEPTLDRYAVLQTLGFGHLHHRSLQDVLGTPDGKPYAGNVHGLQSEMYGFLAIIRI
jgi:hypothetical protein